MTNFIPNSFQMPNGYVDDGLVPLLDGDECKCLLVVARQILGWEQKRATRQDRISLSQLEQKTGLSRPAVVRAMNGLVAANIVLKVEATTSPKDGTLWEINLGQHGPFATAWLLARVEEKRAAGVKRIARTQASTSQLPVPPSTGETPPASSMSVLATGSWDVPTKENVKLINAKTMTEPADFSAAVSLYENRVGVLSITMREEMADLWDDLVALGQPGWWNAAIEVCYEANAVNWRYMRAVLRTSIAQKSAPGSKPTGAKTYVKKGSDNGTTAARGLPEPQLTDNAAALARFMARD